jgi:hypothetical protein
MSAFTRWLPWLLQVPLALVFLVAGYRKLIGDAVPVETFTQLGLGEWFRYFTGVLELRGGSTMPALRRRHSGSASRRWRGVHRGPESAHGRGCS